jgi:hypothetical protein
MKVGLKSYRRILQLARLLFCIILALIGIVIAKFAGPDPFFSNVGLAFMVAGVASLFHEGVLRSLESDETTNSIADSVFAQLKTAPLFASGIRLVSSVRKGYEGYYRWVMSTDPQDMFFAGRSVLHRIEKDFRSRGVNNAAVTIARRLKEGASLKVLLLNPKSELVDRLAAEEGQKPEEMRADIATSLGICEELHKLLHNVTLPASANLDIRVFDEVPYFAYHCVDDTVIIGFYFSMALGHATAAFEVVDLQTRQFFDEHFKAKFSRASEVLRIGPHNRMAVLNSQLLTELRHFLDQKLGAEASKRAWDGSR